MRADLAGNSETLRLVDDEELVYFYSEMDARLFLGQFVFDRANIDVLRRVLVDECGMVHVHHLTDSEVIDQVARRLGELVPEPVPPAAAEVDPEAPFPLHGVQQAYWVGRQSEELGGVSCHFYVELEGKLDHGRLEASLGALVARHDMLRATLLPTGEQQILRETPRVGLPLHDLVGRPEHHDRSPVGMEMLARDPPDPLQVHRTKPPSIRIQGVVGQAEDFEVDQRRQDGLAGLEREPEATHVVGDELRELVLRDGPVRSDRVEFFEL